MAGSASAGIVVVLFIYSKRKKTNAYNDTNLWPAVHNSPRLFVYTEYNVDTRYRKFSKINSAICEDINKFCLRFYNGGL